jgi:hypothetical protein
MVLGLGTMLSAQAAMLVFIPVVFFCYFVNVVAVTYEMRIFQSIKDRFLRVPNGLFSIAVFIW